MTLRPLARIAPILIAVIAIAGCASAPTPTTYYLLRGESAEQTTRIDAVARAGLGRVIAAPYLLASRGIMVETGPGEINPAIQHQWAEPVDAGLRWYLRSQVGHAMGEAIGGGVSDRQSWDYTVDVIVSQLHATMDGTALIDAVFVIIPSAAGDGISQMRFTKSIELPREGYPGVVEAEKALLAELAGLIADELSAHVGR